MAKELECGKLFEKSIGLIQVSQAKPKPTNHNFLFRKNVS
jgi:hypothetical protein